MRATALALLALLALPLAPAGAQAPPDDGAPDERANPTRIVTFYPHVFSIGPNGPMPGNTQYPWGEDDFSRGSPTGCHEAFPKGAGAAAVVVSMSHCDEIPNNMLFVYSTAGFVHADEDTWSYEDFHNERGQAKDVLLDTTQDITATLYMSADAHAWYPSVFVPERLASGVPTGMPVWNWDPGLHPNWQVEASLWLASMGEYQGQASEPPPIAEKFASGDMVLVAQGLSPTQTMVSLDSNINGNGEVYEFAINLGKPQVDRIPKEMDWVLRYRWWSSDGGQRYALPISWNINSGEFYPNRFTLPVKNPFDVELVFPQFLHDKLLIHAMLNSPWGSYDVDARSVSLELVREDDRSPVDPQRIQRVADFSVAHGGHYKPVNVTWVWDHKADALAPGTYRATVTASNFQHSATSETSARFRIHPDGRGEVLEVGRSGQLTATGDQLAGLQGGSTLGARSGSVQEVANPLPLLALLGALALAATGVAGARAMRRRR
jgi:hypothetical protein